MVVREATTSDRADPVHEIITGALVGVDDVTAVTSWSIW